MNHIEIFPYFVYTLNFDFICFREEDILTPAQEAQAQETQAQETPAQPLYINGNERNDDTSQRKIKQFLEEEETRVK